MTNEELVILFASEIEVNNLTHLDWCLVGDLLSYLDGNLELYKEVVRSCQKGDYCMFLAYDYSDCVSEYFIMSIDKKRESLDE